MMKLYLVVGTLGLSTAQLGKDKDYALGKEFLSWSQKHGKEYATELELNVKFNTWKDNREFINSHNDLWAAGKKSYTMKLNKFGDMTNEEYQKHMGLRKGPRNGRQYAKGAFTQNLKDAPDTFDWRDHNIVNPVKDQGQCGSCWSFSAVAAMEGAYNYKANGTVPSACKTSNGGVPSCSFSEQELVDCTNNGEDDCDTGGEMSDGVMEIVKNHNAKINTEDQYKYTSGGGTSRGNCKAQDDIAVDTGFSGYEKIKVGDEDAMKQAVYEKTIISIAIDASQMSFQFYDSGVYDEPKCMSADEDLDHGVSIVGYGAKSGQDYWVVRNSWGRSWGASGYILMSRNKDNQCGVATDSIYATFA